MRSLLTRRVFRLIVHNELHSTTYGWAQGTGGCLRAQAPAKCTIISKRYLFGFSRKPKRRPKPIDFDPGYKVMLDLNNRSSTGVRRQKPEEVAQAFVEFFRAKLDTSRPLEDVQAQHALTAFEYLQETAASGEWTGLATEEIRLALNSLKLMSKEYRTHNGLARMLFAELQRRWETSAHDETESARKDQDIIPFILVLAQSGSALYARELAEEYWEDSLKDTRAPLWPMLLQGLIREKKSDELQNTVDIMHKHSVPFDAKIHQAITTYFAHQEENMEMTKTWYSRSIASGQLPTAYTNATVLKLCIKKNELDWGDGIFKSLLEGGVEDLGVWKIILQWSAAKGRSVDEIERMIQVMVNRSKERGKDLHPDIDTINGLIWLANSKNDPYTAERYLSLGQKLGLQPDARTYLLQLEYRLKVGDLGGARTAYARLKSEEVPNQEDLPLSNKLIVALCEQQPQDHDAVMGLVDDIGERKGRFEPETVVALSRLHLRRDEMDDLVDLLNTHAFHYGLEQRALIADVLFTHCLNPSVSVSRAWETYNILRQTFPETDVSARTALMNQFFKRGRSDMATHVFGHMRQQQVKSSRPSVFTYAQCLAGLGRAADLQSLETVHNMIKLDSEIEPNTQLYNALMLAYSGCGESSRALEFWQDIVHSREGPTYASIQIALRACEKVPFGERHAREIWGKLQRFEIEVTREIYAAYVGALAGQSLFDECVELIDNAEKDARYQPDALL